MPDPKEMVNGVANLLQTGLGMLGQGVNGLSSVLQSADSAVRSLDNSLTGQPNNPAQGQNATEGIIANQVVTLVRQGRDAATQQGNNAQAPASIRGFQQAMGLLLQNDIPAVTELANMMPSPTEVVRMGLKDLRGSTALARLAQGAGTMDDVQMVAQFAEELVGRVQGTQVRPVAQPEAPAKKTRRPRTPKTANPSNEAPNPSNGTTNPSNETPKRRQRKKKAKEGTTLPQQPPPEGDIALAQAVAEVMKDDLVTEWFKDFESGAIPEEEWVGRIGQYAHKRGMEGLDEVLEQANARLEDVMARRASGQY